MEPLYVVNVIWVVEDVYWLAVDVSFHFLFNCTYLEQLAGCFGSVCHFRFAVGADVRSCFLKPKKIRLFQNMNELMKDCSLEVFRNNTGCICQAACCPSGDDTHFKDTFSPVCCSVTQV